MVALIINVLLQVPEAGSSKKAEVGEPFPEENPSPKDLAEQWKKFAFFRQFSVDRREFLTTHHDLLNDPSDDDPVRLDQFLKDSKKLMAKYGDILLENDKDLYDDLKKKIHEMITSGPVGDEDQFTTVTVCKS